MTAHEKMTIFLIMYGAIFIKEKEKRVDGERACCLWISYYYTFLLLLNTKKGLCNFLMPTCFIVLRSVSVLHKNSRFIIHAYLTCFNRFMEKRKEPHTHGINFNQQILYESIFFSVYCTRSHSLVIISASGKHVSTTWIVGE